MKFKQSGIVAVIILTTLVAMAFTNVSERIGLFIRTNYFDLPRNEVRNLQNQLRTNNLNSLTENEAKVLSEYLQEKLFENPTPWGVDIRGNYFWNIYNALPKFVSAKERHTGYNQGAREYSAREQLMAYAIYRINRGPDNLKTIFNIFKPQLKSVIPTNVYNNTGLNSYVEQAIGSYKEISQIPNYERLLKNAYTHVDTATGALAWEGSHQSFRKFENSAYGFSMYELNQIINSHLNIDSYSDLAYSPWLSFWMRRHHEGNMRVVYDILNEIKDIYTPKTAQAYGKEVSHLSHQGKIVYFEKWNDSNGENVLILSEEFEEIGSWGPPSSNVNLYAYHYANSGREFRLINKHTDSQIDCDFQNRARFMEESVRVTDVDNDGFSEVTFAYRLGCTSELSPDGLFLVTMDNGKNYSIKGSTKVILDSSIPPLGGETNISEGFHKADFRLLRNALEIWEAQQESHHAANLPRLHQLSELEKFHNIILFGVEPYWSIRMHHDRLAYTELSEESIWYSYTDIYEVDGGYRIIAEGLNTDDTIDLSFSEGTCSDGMSDYTYPYNVSLTRKGSTYEGCARWAK